MIRKLYESNSNLFGVKLYDPYSGEYVVYWSQKRNITREIYNTLRDSMWIRYNDLYDFVDQINPRFNKYTWDDDDDFAWDYDEAFVADGVHESEGEINIIYELPLDTKHYAESISRHRRSNESMRRNKGKKLRKEYIVHPSEHPVTIRPDFDNTINIFNRDEDFKNQLLGRLVSDCDYFLGNGNGFEGHLWAESVEEQIDTMRKLYHDIRPNWLSEKQIDDYEDAMLAVKYNKNESMRRTKRRGFKRR
jgi:hypothetical protein